MAQIIPISLTDKQLSRLKVFVKADEVQLAIVRFCMAHPIKIFERAV